MPPYRRAFTAVEALVVVTVCAVLLAIVVAVLIGAPERGPRNGLQDATMVRGTLQAIVLYAQGNQDRYPMPSELDVNNATIATDDPRSKDTSANIMSILVWQGYIPTEILVSPGEVNASIAEYEDYEFDAPKAAADPDNALWDPAFPADFTTGVGSLSYAHATPDALWKSTFNQNQAQLGNRGPEIRSVAYDSEGAPSATLANPKTNTFLIHGSRTAWEGAIGYADNHVKFENSMAPDQLRYTALGG